jgi:alkanesulfonate monooxygenase SsuD/methylene tetrahydromethanopterin reductase-like flavin-dependent oxidoreductase (luciferase family)
MQIGMFYQMQVPRSSSRSYEADRFLEMLDQAAYAEEMGLSSVWMADHQFRTEWSHSSAPDVTLGALSQRTSQMRLGIAVVVPPVQHPLHIAARTATLDILSKGRVDLGVGRSGYPYQMAAFGTDLKDATGMVEEALEIIPQAWSEGEFTYQGNHYKIPLREVHPKPVQQPHPPIRAAANSLDTFELMGRLGYPIFVASQVNPFAKMRELIPVYHEARAAAGHAEASSEDISLLGPLYVGNSQAQIREELEPSIRRFLQSVSSIYSSQGENLGPESSRIKEVLERVRRMNYDKVSEVMGIFETPQACVERLKGLQEEFGMGRMICWFNPGGTVPHSQVMRSMELFAAKVMPHFNDGS